MASGCHSRFAFGRAVRTIAIFACASAWQSTARAQTSTKPAPGRPAATPEQADAETGSLVEALFGPAPKEPEAAEPPLSPTLASRLTPKFDQAAFDWWRVLAVCGGAVACGVGVPVASFGLLAATQCLLFAVPILLLIGGGEVILAAAGAALAGAVYDHSLYGVVSAAAAASFGLVSGAATAVVVLALWRLSVPTRFGAAYGSAVLVATAVTIVAYNALAMLSFPRLFDPDAATEP